MLRIRRFRYEPAGAYVWWVSYKAIPASLRETPWDLCPPEWLNEWLTDGWIVHGGPSSSRKEALTGAADLIAGRHLHAVPNSQEG